MKLPTDLEILNAIYEMYLDTYQSYVTDGNNDRQSKIHVPIDCKAVARKLKTDNDIIFIRLDSVMEQRYSYRRDDGSKVAFFSFRLGKESKCINFPLMAAVLSEMRAESRKAWLGIRLSTFAVVISIVGVIVQVLSFN
ncbi:hypothetical protein [Pseudomonas sp. S9]|uniref:hypothetical protein n=1 Tax=Pseudomonas sp. S9 TaxID=686578 RepID=UPI00025572E6|nr:hypothetical protein [Pseudomonas sp. S9]